MGTRNRFTPVEKFILLVFAQSLVYRRLQTMRNVLAAPSVLILWGLRDPTFEPWGILAPWFFVSSEPAHYPPRENSKIMADMAHPGYQRTSSTNLIGGSPSFRQHDGKFGIITGGSRGN